MIKHFRVPGRLALRLKELEVSLPDVLRRSGLPRDLFAQTRVLVSTAEFFALWRAVGSVSPDPLIGLKLGLETKTERFHPMAIAALSTENFVAAVRHMARFKKLTAPEEILWNLDESDFSISFRWLLAVDTEPQVLTDYCFAWMLSLARHGTGTRRSSPQLCQSAKTVYTDALPECELTCVPDSSTSTNFVAKSHHSASIRCHVQKVQSYVSVQALEE